MTIAVTDSAISRIKLAQRKYRETHREEERQRSRAYYWLNLEKERLRSLKYQTEHLEEIRIKGRIADAKPERRARKAELERSETRKAARRAYGLANPRAEYHRDYEKAYRERRKQLHDEKQKSDPQYRIRRALRSSLKNAIKHQRRAGSAIDSLGCSIDELRRHLEKQWALGMSWENFGRLTNECETWQIDHIFPLSRFDLTDPLQVAKACHFTNLAPLWAIDNRKKGNRIVSGKSVQNVIHQ